MLTLRLRLDMLKSVKKVLCIAVLLVPVFSSSAVSAVAGGPQDSEKILLRWKWRKASSFRYHLHGDIVSAGEDVDRSIITSVITITAKSDKSASFVNTYTEIRWHEKDAWYNATEEGLKQRSVAFTIDTASRVSGGDEKLTGQHQEFLDALMGLPPGPVAPGSFWVVDLEEGGLHGTCEFTGFVERGERRKCAVFELELASQEKAEKKPVRELTATLLFDVQEGCFVRVERRIQTRGARRKDEKLTVEVISSPKYPSVARKEEMLIENLQRRLKRKPDSIPVMRKLSDSYARLGKLQEAGAMLERILRKDPKHVDTLVRKGELLLAQGDAKGALASLRRAIELDGKHSRAHLGAARAALALGRYADCVGYARDSLDEEGRHPYQAYYVLGSALAKLGKLEEARKCLERYVELDPGIEKGAEPIITFTADNDVRLVVPRSMPGVDVGKRLKYTPEELAEGRELIKVLVKEESVRLRLTPEEIEKLLDYMAALYGKKTPEMIADFLTDRERTYRRLRKALKAEIALPRDMMHSLAAVDEIDPVTMEALLSMLEPADSLKRLEELVWTHPRVARYHYLLGRYCLNEPDKFGCVNRAGKMVIAMQFDEARDFSEGLACVRINGKWGYIDKTGKTVVEPRFDDAYSLREGLARVRTGSRWSYIDRAGKTVIRARFDWVGDFHEGRARVKASGRRRRGRARRTAGKFGFIDTKGKVVIKLRFDDASRFSHSLAPVKVADKWGYADSSGKVVIEPEFEQAGVFSDGLAVVQVGGKKGYLDKSGKIVIQARFDKAWEFHEGRARVEVRRKSGYIDGTGKLVVQPVYDVASHFSEGLAPVVVGGKWSYINDSAATVIKPGFTDAAPFSEGLACVKIGTGWGYIDRAGKVAVKARYDRAGPFSEGLASVRVEGRQARIACQRFELAGMFDEKSALYRYAKAFVSMKLRNYEGMLEELVRAVDLKGAQTNHVRLANERLRILTRMKYCQRVRKMTAWSLNDEAEAKMVKQLLGVVLTLAQRCPHAMGVRLARHVRNLARQLEAQAGSALMFVTARSQRESALGVLVDLLDKGSRDEKELRREVYAKELPAAREALAGLEEENLVYLRAYVNFLQVRDHAFQVEHITAPAKLEEFINKLLKDGEVALLKEMAVKLVSAGDSGGKAPGGKGGK